MRPGKATESDILAWIEGELPADRAGAVEAAFAEDPSLRAWATSMRGDRGTLQAWTERTVRSAPVGLAESAIERVERDALLGPSEAETLALTPRRESPAMALRVRRYATAAAVVLLVGVIAVVGVQLGTNQGWLGAGESRLVVRGPDAGKVAMGHDEAPSDPHDDLLDAVSRGVKNEIALAREEGGVPLPEMDRRRDMAMLASAAPTEGESVAGDRFAFDADDADGSGIRPLSKATALTELIEQLIGEVAIAGGPVISISPEQASMAGVRDRVVVRAWSDDPEAVADAMRALTGAASSPAAGWHVVTGGPEDASPVAGVVCTVSLPGEAAGFAWFVDALRQAGASRVALTLRDGSAPDTAPDNGISDAAGALWWGEPIRVWAGWARVPVLISPSDSAAGAIPTHE